MIINDNGEIINNYRRMSIGWKELTKTNSFYKEGAKLMPFKIKNLNTLSVVCGDLWDDNILNETLNLVNLKGIDFVIWPNHLDYTIEQFNEEINDYAYRTKSFNMPVLLINDISELSLGGAFVFKGGKAIKKLNLGSKGILEIQISRKKN